MRIKIDAAGRARNGMDCKELLGNVALDSAFGSWQVFQKDNCIHLVFRFDCDGNTFVLPKEFLSLPRAERSHHLKSIFKQVISSVDLQVREGSVEKRVLGLLRENLRTYVSIDSLARALHMSRATLYRRLKEEKTSFSRLLDQERQRLFARHRHRTAAQLCHLLGFRDPSAYYKARKRWYGKRDRGSNMVNGRRLLLIDNEGEVP